MNEAKKPYEPPRLKIYQFDDNDQILTASGDVTTTPTPNYAANALNELMGGTNTTIEWQSRKEFTEKGKLCV